MGKKETVEVLVEGGKASPAPPLGSSLGPLKVNVAQIVLDINKKTGDFKGMKVPVKVIVDTETKAYEIEIGTPPTAELIKKEINIKAGSGEPNKLKAGIIALEQVIKVARMKQGSFFIKDFSAAVRTVLGTCQSLGLLVDGKEAHEVIEEIRQGKHEKLIKEQVTEVPKVKAEEHKKIAVQLEKQMAQSKKEKEAAKAAKEAAKAATEKPAEGQATAPTTAAGAPAK